MNRSTVSRLALVAALVLTSPAWAAKITVNNLDGAGEGLNDATVVATVTGNDGTTLGQQRLNALIAAANTLGARLNSSVEIFLDAKMDPLPCDAGGAILGGAGANTVFGNFPNAYVPNTWYHAALANSIADYDLCIQGGCGLNPVDMSATFNSDIDNNPNCLAGTDWYYGVGATAPAGTTSLYETALHELTHGFGFSTFVDLNDPMDPTFGDELGMAPDIYETFLEDHSTGMNWPAMNSAERATSAVDTGDLHWNGGFVRGACSRLETGGGTQDGHVDMYAPSPFEAGSSVGHFSDTFVPDELMEPIATITFEDHLTRALFRDIGWSEVGLAVRPVGDVDSSGFDDVAALATDFDTGQHTVYVRDGDTGASIQTILLPTNSYPIDMEIMDSFGGTTAKEIAVLRLNPATNGVNVSIYDASSGALLNTVSFGSAYKPIDLEIMANYGGTAAPEVTVLAKNFTADFVRVTSKDASSGLLVKNVLYSERFNPIDLEIVASFGGSAAEEMAVLARDCADNSVIVDIKDGMSGNRLQKINYSSTFIPVDLEVLPNINHASGTAAEELAMIGRRATDGLVKVRIKDSQNKFKISEINFGGVPVDLEIVPHFADSSAPEIAFLYLKPSNGSIIVKIKDALNGTTLDTLTLSANRAPHDLGISPDIGGDGISEMIVMTVRRRDNERRAVIVGETSIGLP